MGMNYASRYSVGGHIEWEGDNFGMPSELYLGSTPLNQALVAFNQMIPIFKNKNKIEKMSVITLTDGGANWSFGSTMGDDDKVNHDAHGNTPVIKIGKKSYSTKGEKYFRSDEYTGLLLDILRTEHQISTIGFFVTKKVRTWDMDRYINNYKDYQDKEQKRIALRSSMTKNRFASVDAYGYSKYFLLNGKKMNIENTNLDSINDNMKSRVSLNYLRTLCKGESLLESC